MNNLQWLLPTLSTAEWLSHISIFIINISLFIFAKPLLSLIEKGKDKPNRIRIFKALNLLVLLLHIIDLIVLRTSSQYEGYFIRVGLSLMTIYAALFSYSLCAFFARKRFGKQKQVDNQMIYLDTYSTRVVDLILLAIIALTAIYSLIKVWGADSLLETTGIFGITAALIAFTSSIWGPDVISGLIILNSQMLEDGDVVIVDGYSDEYIINKVSLIYIILYDVRNNHRTLIRNNRFIQSKIDNLSRVASTDGIRQALVFNIGYMPTEGLTPEERHQNLKAFKLSINRMFNRAFEECKNNPDIKINNNKSFEWAITNTANYALEYTLWVYLEKVPNTKVTGTIRKHLIGTTYSINDAVYTAAIAEDINLETPMLANLKLNNT